MTRQAPLTPLYFPCHCGCGEKVNSSDRWHYVRRYNAWFATPTCFNEWEDAKFEGRP